MGHRVWTVVRVLYAGFWLVLGVSPLFVASPYPPQPTAEANAFWDALVATGFIVPMLSAVYAAGGACCLARRTTPLGLALLSVPLAVIVPFNVLLARLAGPWIVVVAVHLALLWRVRRALQPLWSNGDREVARHIPAR